MNTIGTMPTNPGRSVSPRLDGERPDSSSFRDVFADQKRRDHIDRNNGPYLDRAGRKAEESHSVDDERTGPVSNEHTGADDVSTSNDADRTDATAHAGATDRPDEASDSADDAPTPEASAAMADEATSGDESETSTDRNATLVSEDAAVELLASLPSTTGSTTTASTTTASTTTTVADSTTTPAGNAFDGEATSALDAALLADEIANPKTSTTTADAPLVESNVGAETPEDVPAVPADATIDQSATVSEVPAATGEPAADAPTAPPTSTVQPSQAARESTVGATPSSTAAAGESTVAAATAAAAGTSIGDAVPQTPELTDSDATADTVADAVAAERAAGRSGRVTTVAGSSAAAGTQHDLAADQVPVTPNGDQALEAKPAAATSTTRVATPAATAVETGDAAGTERPSEVAGPNNPTPTSDQSRTNGASARLAEHVAMRDLVERVDRHRLATSGKLEFEIQSERFGAVRVEAVDGRDGVELSLRGDGSARQDLSDLADQLRQEFDRDGDGSAAIRIDGDEVADVAAIRRDRLRPTGQGSGFATAGRGVDLRL